MSDITAHRADSIPLAEVTAGRWTLDPVGSSVAIRHVGFWGLYPIKGAFTRISGEGEILPDGYARGTLTIDSSSVDTGIAKRDQHLLTADFFDVDNHPSFVFTATRVFPNGPVSAHVTGELTVLGATRPIDFAMQATEASQDAVTLAAEVGIARKDFGMTWNRLKIMKDITAVTITARFTRD